MFKYFNLLSRGAGVYRNKVVHVLEDPNGESVTGGDKRDFVFASEGDHVIATGGGNDWISVGDGNSTIDAGQGNDRVYGGDGDYDIDGGAGNDRISVGYGNSVLKGGEGNDRIFAAGGNNWIDGGTGQDRIRTGYGSDTIYGGDGDDRIRSFGGDNLIDGGTGDDRIRTGWGNDTLSGGSGHDYIFSGWGDDVVSGGSGHDLIRTGRGNDMVTGGSGDDWIRTGRDNDTASGGAGDDWIELRHGDDTGVYVLSDNAGSSDVYSGGRGQDTLRLELTAAEWQDADVQADIAAYQEFLEGVGNRGWWRSYFSFTAFDLVVSSFEALDIRVDGVVVTPGDQLITAVDDANAVQEGNQVSGNVLDNDQVPDQLDHVTLIQGVSRGALSLDAQGTYTYATNGDFDGLALGETTTETFTYQVRDLDGDVATATVTLTITGTNSAPTLAAGVAQAVEDGAAIEVDLTALGADGDSDNSGADLVYTLAAPLSEGGAVIEGGMLRFEPGDDFQDLAQGQTRDVVIQVTATDAHGAQGTNTVTVTVVGTNDAPVMIPGTATVAETGPAIVIDLALLANDPDAGEDGMTLDYAVLADPSGGTATVVGHTLRFEPGPEFADLAVGESRDVVIELSGTDAEGAQATTAVTVTVTGTNDAPTLAAYLGAATEDGDVQTVDLSALSTDPDASDVTGLTYSITSGPAEGTALITASQLSFDPGVAFQDLGVGQSRTVTLDVMVQDSQGATATNTISFTVAGVNDGPTAVADGFSGDEDLIINGNVLTNDSDIDGDPLSAVAGTWTTEQGGTVVMQADGSFAYTPPTDFHGVDRFDYQLSDGTALSTAAVTLTVQATNDAPTAAPGQAGAVEDGAVVTGSLATLATDTDSALLSFALVSPVAGLVLAADGSYSFDPGDAEYQDLAVGEERVVEAQYVVTDDQGASAQSTLTFTITGTNDAPVAQALSGQTSDEITLAPSFTDADGSDSQSVSIDTTGTQGTVSVNANASMTYVTGSGFASLALGEEAQDSFTYAVDDGQGGSDSATAHITLVGLNDAPTLAGETLEAEEDGAVVTLDLSTLGADIDSDDDGTSLTYTVSGPPSEGAVSITGTTLSFDPGPDFQDLNAGESRNVVVQVTATDRHGASAVAEVTVTVSGKNEPSSGVNTQALIVGLTVPNTTMVITSFTDSDGDGAPDLPLSAAQSAALPDANGFSDYRTDYGDLDGDGDIDMVIAQGDRVSAYFNNGDANADGVPEFQQVVLSHAQINYGVHDVAVGDFDGNGIDDIVLSGGNGDTLIFMGQGDTDGSGAVEVAEYGTPVSVANAAGQNYGTTVADLNGDGHLDVVQANYTAGPIEVLYGDGAGGFTQRLINDAGGENTLHIAVGDLNGDGRADMVAARSNGQDDILYLNQGDTDGDGQDDFARSVFNSGGDNMEVELADLDGDGDLDVIMAEYSNAGTAIYMNDGTGGLSKLTLPSGDGPYGAATGIAVGDIDGDGDYDIVASHWYDGTGHTVLLNNGGSDMGLNLMRTHLDSTAQSWDVEFINITDDLIFV